MYVRRQAVEPAFKRLAEVLRRRVQTVEVVQDEDEPAARRCGRGNQKVCQAAGRQLLSRGKRGSELGAELRELRSPGCYEVAQERGRTDVSLIERVPAYRTLAGLREVDEKRGLAVARGRRDDGDAAACGLRQRLHQPLAADDRLAPLWYLYLRRIGNVQGNGFRPDRF